MPIAKANSFSHVRAFRTQRARRGYKFPALNLSWKLGAGSWELEAESGKLAADPDMDA